MRSYLPRFPFFLTLSTFSNIVVMKFLRTFFLALIVLGIGWSQALACTNYLVTKGASADGSTMVSYAADSHIRYGELYFSEAADWPSGSMLTIYDRGTNRPLGQIPQVPHTYRTIGFMNEYQVAIGETTFGGRSELVDSTAIMDYGYLMFTALQRAPTAREAIRVIADLVEQYGYASSGESFSIGDPNEVWIMEIIGKGVELAHDKKTGQTVNRLKGAVWVAMRIPDGYVSAHANHARITSFPKANGKTSITDRQWKLLQNADLQTIYKHDVIAFARKQGYFSGKDEHFSFSDTYAPLSFDAARFCELRVWSMFNHISDSMAPYWNYAKGAIGNPRMPLFIKPNRKLTPQDLMSFKRDYLQGTELDMSKDAGAGAFGLPYRWRPLTWEYEGKEYFHERVTVTQQTGFSFIAQLRSWLPNEIGGVFWFGVDDAGSTVYVPFYAALKNVPLQWSQGYGDMLTYKDDAAFWVFNKVAHFAYLFYNRVMPDIRKRQNELESLFARQQAETDGYALALYSENPDKARDFLSRYSSESAMKVLNSWQELFGYLMVKYLDGNVKQEDENGFKRNPWGYPASPRFPGYDDAYKKQVIDNTGVRFRML